MDAATSPQGGALPLSSSSVLRLCSVLRSWSRGSWSSLLHHHKKNKTLSHTHTHTEGNCTKLKKCQDNMYFLSSTPYIIPQKHFRSSLEDRGGARCYSDAQHVYFWLLWRNLVWFLTCIFHGLIHDVCEKCWRQRRRAAEVDVAEWLLTACVRALIDCWSRVNDRTTHGVTTNVTDIFYFHH